jgi:hypothetical protein
VIAAPPSEDGTVQVTVAEALPAVADTLIGAPGAVARADTAKTVPVSWERLGLLVELMVAETHAGGPAV